MNKKRIILFLLFGVPFVIGILWATWFISNIKIYGNFTITYIDKNEDTLSTILIKAHTPTGREVTIPFVNNKAFMGGFFKDVSIVLPCNDNIEKVTLENNWKKKSYSLIVECAEGKKKFAIPEEMVIGRSFWNKSFALFNWFFSNKTGQEIIFGLLILFVLFISFLIFKQTRKKARIEETDLKKKLLKQALVILSGFIFWIIIIFILLEVSLRIFGSYYNSKQTLPQNDDDDKITILCIGDSFTYGIGAHNDKSYPAQLESLINKNENFPVRVINAGICAGNTTQMLEETQDLLQKNRPDIVVMLFGMANSWNYYGFTNSDNFLYRIRTYKLIIRITQNLKYKKNGFEMWKRANDFSNQLLARAVRSVLEHKGVFDISYNTGKYYLSNKEWKKAISKFSQASSYRPFDDSTRNALWVCTEKMDYEYYYNNSQKKPIENTPVKETVKILDSLIRVYPNAVDLQIIKYRYLAVKGDTVSSKEIILSLCEKYPDKVVSYFDLDKVMTKSELKNYFESKPSNNIKSVGYIVAKGYYFLKNNKPELAEACFADALKINHNEYFAEIGEYIIKLQNPNNDKTILKNDEKYLMKSILIRLHTLIFENEQKQTRAVNKDKAEMYLNHFKSMIQQDAIEHKDKRDSLFFSYSGYLAKLLKEMLHDDFFLYHPKKRSMTLQEQDVFQWIKNDINTITDICIKQGYPLICMNYPIIPPPNSEEISFWATNVGILWEKIAKQKNILFINQDSLFSLYGENKGMLFEPTFTGTEHCNEKGYALMASNIYQCMKNNHLLKNKKNLNRK